jgi:transcriptional regulator with XRE-family HTH domain
VGIEVFKKRVGRLIRSAREAAGLRQDDVAERVGPTITKSIMSRYESGGNLPKIDRLKEILAACGVEHVPPAIEAGYRQVSQESPAPYGQVFATEAAKEFIEVWLRVRSINEASEALGMHRQQVKWYLQRLRRLGVDLPPAQRRHPGRTPKEDVQALRDFLESKLASETKDEDHD